MSWASINRVELADAGTILRRRILQEHMLAGVSVTDSDEHLHRLDVSIGQDTTIEPGTFLYAGTTIGEDCTIGPMARISRAQSETDAGFWASQLVEVDIDSDVSVGPFSESTSRNEACEQSEDRRFCRDEERGLRPGAQASHLSYIGDAEVGAGTNIGAGTITCNYDGYRKHRTVIGRNAFIGLRLDVDCAPLRSATAPLLLQVGRDGERSGGCNGHCSLADHAERGMGGCLQSRKVGKQHWRHSHRGYYNT